MNKPKSPIETLDAAEVATLLNAGKLLLIDVREPAEYASERIAGALLYPLSTFDATSLPEDGARRYRGLEGGGPSGDYARNSPLISRPARTLQKKSTS